MNSTEYVLSVIFLMLIEKYMETIKNFRFYFVIFEVMFLCFCVCVCVCVCVWGGGGVCVLNKTHI